MSKMHLESSGNGTSSHDGLSMDVPIAHGRPLVAAFRDFAVLADTTKSTKVPRADCGESLIVGVKGPTLAEVEAIKKSTRPVGFGNFDIFASSNSTKSLGIQVTLVSETTNQEKDHNGGAPPNLIKTSELAVRETTHGSYPSQRRTSFHDFRPACGRFAPKLNDGERPKVVASPNVQGMKRKAHEDHKHVVENKGRGDKYAYGGRGRTIRLSESEVKRLIATSSRVAISKGKELVHDMHVDTTNLVKKKDRGDEYESPAYGGRGGTISQLEAKRLTATPSRVHDTHDNPSNLVKKKNGGDVYDSLAYCGRDRISSQVPRLRAKRPTATASRFREYDMHDDPTNLVKKKTRGGEYDSLAYYGRGRTISKVSRLEAKEPTSARARIHTFVNKYDVARGKVKETLRLFQATFRILLRGEEVKSNEEHASKRIDLSAYNILKDNRKFVNVQPIFGPVPGVEVGDEFLYRAELSIVGLHHELQKGIDYHKKGLTYLATSIVACEDLDNMDMPDVIIYLGQGGKADGGKKQAEDQKLEQGNLALKNSMDKESPVRVIRRFKEKMLSNKIISRYIYDGLYLVEKYWKEQGCTGTNVFKFQLTRIPGQKELGFKEVRKSKFHRVGICESDISRGNEKIAISAVNTIDKERPPSIKYMKRMRFPPRHNPTPPRDVSVRMDA